MTGNRTAKVCVLGDFAVGKTSTVARFVHNEFSDKYLTTVGVKIDIKEVDLDAQGSIKLILWDIAGTDALDGLQQAYLRGASAYLLIADGTRRETISNALNLHRDVQAIYGSLPFVALVNKSDLDSEWEVGEDETMQSRGAGVEWLPCSAKSGENVEDAIRSLAVALIRQ